MMFPYNFKHIGYFKKEDVKIIITNDAFKKCKGYYTLFYHPKHPQESTQEEFKDKFIKNLENNGLTYITE